MILTREQINRYLRHIIMLEISGPGQKKLLESTVFICGESVDACAPAVYYLAASGVGSITCHFDDPDGVDRLFTDIRDLNSDVSIGLSDGITGNAGIFIGKPAFIAEQCNFMDSGSVPFIVALCNGWKGGMKVFKEKSGLNPFLKNLSDKPPLSDGHSPMGNRVGETLSVCLLGALAAMEVIKLSLGLGETSDEFLFFNLFSMEFRQVNQEDLPQALNKLFVSESSDDIKDKLRDGKVLIAGTGGLGSPAAYALVKSGVGTIGLVDYDVVEISNLNRQILHSTSRIGMPKAESAAVFLERLNPRIHVKKYHTALTKENVYEIIDGYDMVIIAVDNFPTRFLLNDACYFKGKPLIDAGVLRFDGTCLSIMPGKSPCYRCVRPNPPPPGSVPSCSESGVLGPVPGILGFIQAAEAVKLLSGLSPALNGRILFFNGVSSDFTVAQLNRNNKCPLCGTEPAILELQEYQFVCGEDKEV